MKFPGNLDDWLSVIAVVIAAASYGAHSMAGKLN
jgi:hypothetical protein